MERSIFFIVFILFSNFLCAQTLDKEYDYFNQEEAEFLSPVNDPISGSKTNFGLMTGTSVGAFSGRNSFVNTFVAPYLSYSLSPRMNINAAAVLGNTQYNYSSERNLNQSFNSKNLMVGMDYKISKNVTIGAGFQISQGIQPFNNQAGFSQFGHPFSPGISPFMAW